MSINRQFVRVGVTLMATGLLALAGAGIASAHVTANSPEQLAQGGDGEIVFRSPNESQHESPMTKLQVNFPLSTPLSNANVEPVPGWRYQVNSTHLATPVKMANDTVTDAVASIVWTAEPGNSGIAPDGFQDFAIYTEGLPTNTTKLVFTATQTYADGEVLNWNQPTPPNGAEPDSPAPELALSAAQQGNPASSSTMDSAARWLGGIGIVLGAAGLGFGAGALWRGRRRPTGPETAREKTSTERTSV